MGNHKKKKKKISYFSASFPIKKRRNINKASSSSSKKRRIRSHNDTEKFCCTDLKDMRKLSSNNESFHLSLDQTAHILRFIYFKKTPTPYTYMRWDRYAISFYLKMCTCFGLDYQHLEATDCMNKPLLPNMMASKEQEQRTECSGMNQPYTKEASYAERLEQCVQGGPYGGSGSYSGQGGGSDRGGGQVEVEADVKVLEEEHVECSSLNQLLTKEMSYAERLEQVESMEIGFSLEIYFGPFKFGSYSSGNTPECIPYHLYLLVKEAVDIMKRFEWHNNTNDRMELATVEKKIRFFCNYFHSHLPAGWSYDRGSASSVVASYDTTRKPRYSMAGYTPIGKWDGGLGVDANLSPQELMDIMSMIHSRKTPSFWAMSWQEISFYYKLCSCFGIDYHCLEAASEDDVCLMNMGRPPAPRFYVVNHGTNDIYK